MEAIMVGRRRRAPLHLKRRQVIAIVVILFATYPAYRALTVTIPLSVKPVTFAFAQKAQATNGMTFPAFQGVATFVFTAKGAFSEGNPISVQLSISNVNITDFLSHYNRVGFTNAFWPNGNNLTESGTIVWGWLPLSQERGTYVTSGTLVWLEGASYPQILPNIKANITSAIQPFGPPVLNVGSATDILAQDSAATNQRLTWVLVALSILMFQPVLEALFLADKKETEQHRP